MRIIGNAGNSARKVQAVASGALASGDTVIVNSDGTVSSAASENVSQDIGTSVSFAPDPAQPTNMGAAFDPDNSKVVIVYGDANNSYYGTAVVGTVSGSSITFGTPVVYRSTQSTNSQAVFDSASGNFIIGFTAFDQNASVVVGTVSGTSISFGTISTTPSGSFRSIVYDSVNNKPVVFSGSNAGYGYVGTVTGTSISFGSAVTVEASVSLTYLDTAFDTASSQIVMSYQDSSTPSNSGFARTASVSGTSMTLGSKTQITSAGSYLQGRIVYDPSNDRIVIVYQDNGVESAIVGTVSGTSISFGTAVLVDQVDLENQEVVFDSSVNKVVRLEFNNYRIFVEYGTVSDTTISFTDRQEIKSGAILGGTRTMAATLAPSINKVLIAYALQDESGSAFVLQVPGEVIKLTSENFIGIASNGYADTQAATINAKGFVDDNQSGLTAGQSYYVQTDGTLSTTAGDPSVFAGTAVSANKLIVKG